MTIQYDIAKGLYIDSVTRRILPAEVVVAIQNRRLIEAIRAWREYSNEDLKTTKDFIDRLAGNTLGSPPPQEPKPSRPPEGDLPKTELLIKMLNMTTSDNDNMALVALRKANEMLAANGWTWERLIRGKITVVEDPFKTSFDPFADRQKADMPAPRPPPRRRPADNFVVPPRPTPPPPPPSPPKPAPIATVGATKTNRYPNTCYCCGISVAANAGFIFDPAAHNSHATQKWEVICSPCNKSTTLTIPDRKKKIDWNIINPSVSDL